MFYLFLFSHLLADFAFQPYWLVKRKRGWDGLAIHGAIVLACMLALIPFEPAVLPLWPIMLLITAIHVATDWWKVHNADKLFRPAIVPFGIDQVIHVSVLMIVLNYALPGPAVWSAFGICKAALYGAGLLAAGLAVPIAVMTWLDPTFKHGALAKHARMRSLVVGLLGMGLVLFAGPLALPLGLLGITLLGQRQRSLHPLDTLNGGLVVLGLAAMIGAMVQFVS